MLGRFPQVIDEERRERAAELARRYLAGRGDLLSERIGQGRVRDGHGDLLADDIFCLDDGPRILDCLDFSDRYRYADVLLDAAFLAMDLERLGRPELGRAFLRWWRDHTGEGLYTDEMSDATYDELVGRAQRLLTRGEPVILDATWTSARHRELASRAAPWPEATDLDATRSPDQVLAEALEHVGRVAA